MATLLIEKSAFKKVKRRARKKQKTGTGSSSAVSAEIDRNPVLVYQKTIHPSLRQYLECMTCRRDVVDKHFNNPLRTESACITMPFA